MSTWDKRYTDRVQLLVEILPVLAQEPRFALGRFSLTRAGELLLPKAEALLAAGVDLSSTARRLQGELSGRIEFGVPSEQADFLRLGEMAFGVQESLPLVELRTRPCSSLQLTDLVRAGALAAGYFIGVNPPRDLQWHVLRSVTYRVAVPLRMSAAMQRGGWLALAELPWIDGLPMSHIHQLLRALFDKQGLSPRVVLQIEETGGIDAYVRAGNGCALLREEIAVRGVERNEWMVWGPAQTPDSHESEAAEQSTVNAASVGFEAAFQCKEGFEATAHVFCAPNAPAGRIHATGLHAPGILQSRGGALPVGRIVVAELDVGVNDAVQRDRRLCCDGRSDGSHRARCGQGQHRPFAHCLPRHVFLLVVVSALSINRPLAFGYPAAEDEWHQSNASRHRKYLG